MSRFAKIIELVNNEQVLLFFTYNNENDIYELVIRTDFEGMEASKKLWFKEEKKALEAIENYSQASAIEFSRQMEIMLTQGYA